MSSKFEPGKKLDSIFFLSSSLLFFPVHFGRGACKHKLTKSLVTVLYIPHRAMCVHEYAPSTQYMHGSFVFWGIRTTMCKRVSKSLSISLTAVFVATYEYTVEVVIRFKTHSPTNSRTSCSFYFWAPRAGSRLRPESKSSLHPFFCFSASGYQLGYKKGSFPPFPLQAQRPSRIRDISSCYFLFLVVCPSPSVLAAALFLTKTEDEEEGKGGISTENNESKWER